jgi:hypothetical protein
MGDRWFDSLGHEKHPQPIALYQQSRIAIALRILTILTHRDQPRHL